METVGSYRITLGQKVVERLSGRIHGYEKLFLHPYYHSLAPATRKVDWLIDGE